MTDKLKCPFCGAELLGTLCTRYCPNEDCMCYSETISTSVWQALIDGKKALFALKEIKETVDAFKDSEFAEDMRDCVRTVSQILASIPTEKDK